MIHAFMKSIMYIISNVRVRSDFILPQVDEGHSWITEGVYIIIKNENTLQL